MMQKHILEAYSQIDEKARITGVALIPRISRNDNLYTKAELKRFDNVSVPLNWEHDSKKQIGTVTFHYNEEMETVFYEGDITHEPAANLARNKTLYTSIEADPVNMKEICNNPGDCFNMPMGLVPVGMAITETPGVPETSVKVIESYLKECKQDHELEAMYSFNLDKSGTKKIEKDGKGCTPMDILLNRCENHTHETNDCISNKIRILDKEDPDMAQDQKIAIAISKCTENEMKEFVLHEILGIDEYCSHCGEKKSLSK